MGGWVRWGATELKGGEVFHFSNSSNPSKWINFFLSNSQFIPHLFEKRIPNFNHSCSKAYLVKGHGVTSGVLQIGCWLDHFLLKYYTAWYKMWLVHSHITSGISQCPRSGCSFWCNISRHQVFNTVWLVFIKQKKKKKKSVPKHKHERWEPEITLAKGVSVWVCMCARQRQQTSM